MIRKYTKNRMAYTKDLNDLIDAVNKRLKLTFRGSGVRASTGPNGTQVTIDPPAGTNIFHAKTQEASTTTGGTVSVKFCDADGTETGDAFDVYAFADKRTEGTGRTGADMEEWIPHIYSEEVIFIKNIDGDWYIDWHPAFLGKY